MRSASYIKNSPFRENHHSRAVANEIAPRGGVHFNPPPLQLYTGVIQREKDDTAAEFMEWFEKDQTYLHWKGANIASQCYPSAKAIFEYLTNKIATGELNITVKWRGIKINPKRGYYTHNHFVILVTLKNGEQVVIDPTQGQFKGGASNMYKESDWGLDDMTLKVTVPINTRDNLKPHYSEFNYETTDGASFDAVKGFTKVEMFQTADDAIEHDANNTDDGDDSCCKNCGCSIM